MVFAGGGGGGREGEGDVYVDENILDVSPSYVRFPF